jgi:energy-coupling factor transport system ATP-binding protein
MPAVIETNHLSYTYLPGSAYEHQALKDINISLAKGEFLGILGPNGSGKSTLAQHFNGLIRPTSGHMTVCGIPTSDPKLSKDLWKKAGLVFQYPEQQIFQVTVFDEVAYGPRNLGLPETEVAESVYDALRQVGINQENINQLSPVTLSGGMRRRVAIAGMLAIQPEILILDEPMAGLDAAGRKLLSDILKKRHEKKETTVMISHNLKEIMTITDKIAILDSGSMIFLGDVKDLLMKPEILGRYQLELPEYLQVVYRLAEKGFAIKTDISSTQEAGAEILRFLQENKHGDVTKL